MAGPSKSRYHLSRHGAVTVELAMVLPLLFLVVLVSIEFSRMNVIRHSVNNAAYEAARRAIVPGATASDAEDTARRMMATCGARGVLVDVTPAVIDLDTPQVTVEVEVEAERNGLVVPRFFAGRRILGRATLEREDL